MTAPAGRIEELTKQGATERQQVASAVRESAQAARSIARRVEPAIKTAAAGLAVAGVALTVATVIRRVRARRKPRFAWKKIRRSLENLDAKIEKNKPRPIAITLLLAAARSKTLRRAIASAAQEAVQNRSPEHSPAPTSTAPALPAPVPRVSPRSASSKTDPAEPESDPASATPPPPVPREEAKAAPLGKKLGIGVGLLKASYREFDRREGFARAASLAYYTLFSIAPLLLIAVSVAGFIFGRAAAQGRLLAQIQGVVGTDAARIIQTMMVKAQKPSANILAAAFGLATLLFGAAGVFGNLQQSLNRIWGVPERPHSGFWKTIQERFLSFAMVLGTGFLLLVSLVVSAALSAVAAFLRRELPGAVGFALNSADAIFSWMIIGVIFALIFKYLPDTRIAWRDVWIGAAITSLLFVIGQFGIGLYIGKTSVSSVYGGAAALAIVLIWTYYSAAIFFFGAEITQIFANWYGSRLVQERSGPGSLPREPLLPLA